MWPPSTSVRSVAPRSVNHWFRPRRPLSSGAGRRDLAGEPALRRHPRVRPGHSLGAVLVPGQLPELAELVQAARFQRHGGMYTSLQPHGTRLQAPQALAERPQAQEEGTREAARCGGGARLAEDEARDVSLVTAIHLYVTDLDRSIDWYACSGTGRPRRRGRTPTAPSSSSRGRRSSSSPGIPSAAARSAAQSGSSWRPTTFTARSPASTARASGRARHEDPLRDGGLRPRRPGQPPRQDRPGVDRPRHRRRGLATLSDAYDVAGGEADTAALAGGSSTTLRALQAAIAEAEGARRCGGRGRRRGRPHRWRSA